MKVEEPRSAEARARAERALVLLLHELRDDDIGLIVLGGLVPEILTSGQDHAIPEHLGTTDVDVLLITHVDGELDLGGIERALKRLDFHRDDEDWRWRGRVSELPVKIEFLCDLDNHVEGEVIRPYGCETLAAMNLRGTGYVARDFTVESLSAEVDGVGRVTVEARFAGLCGYLLSKCVAVRTRAADKDYYDFGYVLLHNRAGGPEAAARALRYGDLGDALVGLSSTLLEVRERYRSPRDAGPSGYFAQAVQVDPGIDEMLTRQDAVDAVGRFFSELAG